MQLLLNQYFEELEIGYETGRSRGRTVTETDVVSFMMITGNWAEIHSNVEYCRDSKFGQRVVQGTLVLGISQGMFTTGRAVAAFYGLDRLRFVKPVFIGDTVHVSCVVRRLEPKDDDFGVAVWEMRVGNQRGEIVQTSEYSLLTHRQEPT